MVGNSKSSMACESGALWTGRGNCLDLVLENDVCSL